MHKSTHQSSDSQNSSHTPVKSLLQPRPFALQAQAEPTPGELDKPELQSDQQKFKGETYGLAGILMASNSGSPPKKLQPKLKIGKVGDRYEQEADRTASEVVRAINQPIQKKLQRKSETQFIQDQGNTAHQPQKPFIRPFKIKSQDEIVQQKQDIASQPRNSFIKPLRSRSQDQSVQRKEAIGGGEASADLESSIQGARGGGQSLDANLQQSMGQAMGADFSGVKVHTDSQSDQLNKSIQAKAFTTGQDVFFRQGAYEPSSRGGQELIAHELTHVVQQNGGAVQRSQSIQRERAIDNDLNGQKSVNPSERIAIIPQIVEHTQSIALQAAFENAFLNETGKPHRVELDADGTTRDKGTLGSTDWFGLDTFKVDKDTNQGKLSTEPPPAQQWLKAESKFYNFDTERVDADGYFRENKLVFHSTLDPVNDTEMEKAYSNDTASLHKITPQDRKKPPVVSGSAITTGEIISACKKPEKKVKVAGDTWIPAAKKSNSKKGFIRESKVVFDATLRNPPGESEPDSFTESFKESADNLGGHSDTISGAIENKYHKETVKGRSVDKETKTHQDNKDAADIASGTGDTLTGLFGVVNSIKDFNNARIANILNGFAGITKATAGAAKTVHASAHLHTGKDKGLGKQGENSTNNSDYAAKVTAPIADGMAAVKDAVFGLIGVYRLYKNTQSDQKGKEALVTLKSFTNAAASAAKTAKGAYDLINKGIPISVVRVVPALGIAVAAINLIIRLYDALKSGDAEKEMTSEADPLRNQIASKFGEQTPTFVVPNPSKVFNVESRGTLQTQKSFLRTKQEVRAPIKDIAKIAHEELESLKAAPQMDASAEKQSVQRSQQKVRLELMTQYANFPGVQSFKDYAVGQNSKFLTNAEKIQEFSDCTVEPLRDIDEKIDTYEFVDKMAEVNFKRKKTAWTDVILEIVNIGADVATIAVGATGLGAIITQGIKAGTGGYQLAKSAGKYMQDAYNNTNADADPKSTINKHKEYVNHITFIYDQIRSLKPTDTAKAEQLKKLIRSTGVNYGMWESLRYDPDSQAEMLYSAMKQR